VEILCNVFLYYWWPKTVVLSAKEQISMTLGHLLRTERRE